MKPDEQTVHETVHVFYRQRLSDTEWELAQALGRESAKDKIIAELRTLIEADASPGE